MQGGSKVTLSIEQTGPMGAVAAMILGRLTQRYIELEAESLDKRVTPRPPREPAAPRSRSVRRRANVFSRPRSSTSAAMASETPACAGSPRRWAPATGC